LKFKVIQWATGAMGKSILRAVIDHPDLELVGLFVYSDEKVGKDAGDIARRHSTGVQATQRIDKILSTEADVVIHAPRIQPPYKHHNEVICRLLASGKNVITINGHSFPQYWGRDYLESIESACRIGGTTLFGTGLNPGFVVEKIATVATGLCTKIENIFISEIFETNQMRDPNYVFDILGFGSDEGAIDPNDPSWAPAEILNGMYSEVVAHLVYRLGYDLDRIETDHIMLPATSDIHTAAGWIKKGTIGHTNWRWHGVSRGKRLVSLFIYWIMETAHLDSKNYDLWNVKINGLPGVKIDINLETPERYPFRTSPEQLAVAASVVNSIPSVCAAKSGVMDIPVANHFKKGF
jgi:hypothetical protein